MPSVIYYCRRHTYTNKCTFTTNFCKLFKLKDFDEYLDETMNLESSFEEKSHQIIWLLFYCLMICSCHICFSLLYYWVSIMCVLMPKVWSMDYVFEVLVVFFLFLNTSLMRLSVESRLKVVLVTSLTWKIRK